MLSATVGGGQESPEGEGCRKPGVHLAMKAEGLAAFQKASAIASNERN